LTEIKCKVSELLEICEIATLKGRNLQGKEYTAVPEFVIDALIQEVPKLSITAANTDNTLTFKLDYNISQVQEAGEIPIGDVKKLMEYLGTFSTKDEVTLRTTENKVIIERETPKKVARIPLTAISNIDSTIIGKDQFKKFTLTPSGYPKSAKSHLNLKINLNAKEIKEVVEGGEVVNQRIYPFNISSGIFTVKVGSEQTGEIETTIGGATFESDPEKVGSKTAKTCFAGGLDNIFGNLDGAVTLYILDDADISPMYIAKDTPKYTFRAFLAPVMPD
jgi:hypothetical protein